MKLKVSIFEPYGILFLIIVSILLFSGCEKKGQDSLDNSKIPDVKIIAETTEVITDQSTELKTEILTEIVTEANPYVRPFDAYILQNEDFMGWIKIDGTSIDDPIVQGVDNAHYLNYDYTGAKNNAGAIFMDYKNQGNFHDNHMILYAHYMKDGTMFHDLHKYKVEDFLIQYPEITISGLHDTEKYEIFSVHIVSAYDYYLYLGLNDEELREYAMHFKLLSMHDKSVTLPDDLKLLTLVTCTYEFDNARLLIHAYQK